MRRKTFPPVGVLACAVCVLVGVTPRVHAQNAHPAYAAMAPIDAYLMADRNAEIALARSAAPEAISRDARVLVLGRHGYETAIGGRTDFVCVVERSWMGPFDVPEFWNPKVRGPICFNPPAARSILPLTIKRTELALSGLSKERIIDSVTAFDKKGLPTLEPGAMSFMLSKQGFLGDSVGHWAPHLMFYVPQTDSTMWGAGFPHSPVLLFPQFHAPEPITVFLVPVAKWSDGTIWDRNR